MTEREPPAGLSTRGAAYWQRVVQVFELDGAELELLHEACRTLDVLDDLAAAVAEQGVTVRGSTKQIRLHPALAEARAQRLALARLLAALELPAEDGSTLVESDATRRGRTAANARWRNERERRSAPLGRVIPGGRAA